MVGGVLLDVDGVLTVSWRALPGACGPSGGCASSTSASGWSPTPRRGQGGGSRTCAVTPRCRWDTGHIVTAVTSAARLLTEEFADRRCLVVNDGDLTEDLNGVPTVGVDGADRAEVVLLGGAGPAVGHAELTAVFRLAGDGVPVIALHRNTRFQTSDARPWTWGRSSPVSRPPRTSRSGSWVSRRRTSTEPPWQTSGSKQAQL